MPKEEIINNDIVSELKDMQDENNQAHLIEVNLIIGRFQPFSVGHLDMAKELYKENGLETIYVYVRSKNSKFSNKLTLNYMEDVCKDEKLVKDTYSMETSLISDVIKEAQRRGYNPILLGTGKDRYESYLSMSNNMVDIITHKDFKVYELNNITYSTTEVRNCIIEGDQKKFNKLVPKSVVPYYSQMKDELEGNNILTESVSLFEFVYQYGIGITELKTILESYNENIHSDVLVIETILDNEVKKEINMNYNEDDSVNEVASKEAKKFIKGMEKIKLDKKFANAWLPGHKVIYFDKENGVYYFIDSDGDAMELKNLETIKQLEKTLDSMNEAIKYKKGKTYQTGNGWTVYKNDDQVHFSIEVNPAAGWDTDPHYPSEMRFMDSGKRKGTYRLKSGNIEKQAKEMFDIGTKENDEYYGLTYKDYADIIRLSIDMQNSINMNEAKKIKFDYDYSIYNPTFGSTLDVISDTVEKSGYFIDDNEFFTAFGDAFFKPKKGKTLRKSVELLDKSGTTVGILNVQIYNRGTSGNTYELNMYCDTLTKKQSKMYEGYSMSRRQFLQDIKHLLLHFNSNFKAKEELYGIIKDFYGDHGITVFENMVSAHRQSLAKAHTKLFDKSIMIRTGEFDLDESVENVEESQLMTYLNKLPSSRLEKFRDSTQKTSDVDFGSVTTMTSVFKSGIDSNEDISSCESMVTDILVNEKDFTSFISKSSFIKKEFRPFMIMEGMNCYDIDKHVNNLTSIMYEHYSNYFNSLI